MFLRLIRKEGKKWEKIFIEESREFLQKKVIMAV